jgi:hypothetical protein
LFVVETDHEILGEKGEVHEEGMWGEVKHK